MEIRPQDGPQTQLLECSADIAIYGGSAGGGKTYGILLDALRHVGNPSCGAVIFRRTSTQIKNEGGLWDEAKKLCIPLGAKTRESPQTDLVFSDPDDPKREGFKITFSHLQHEKNKYDYQGAQIPVIYFDELTHFSKSQFLYMMSRNRSVCGVKPYIRATCNPDKNSWVREFIDWYIDEDGWAIPERSGKLRWLCVYDEKYHWFDSKAKAKAEFSDIPALSVTFILSRLKDNKILLKKDPLYLAKLKAMPKVERERLLGDPEKGGNWDIMPTAGMYFKRHYFEEIDILPQFLEVVRCWDRAATEWNEGESGKPDATASVKMGKTNDGKFVILDVVNERYSTGNVEKLILNTAKQDGVAVKVKGFQDPGSAGKSEAEAFVKMLSGFNVAIEKISIDKETAAKPMSAQSEHGNVKVWTNCRNKEMLYSQLDDFPKGSFDDIVDGATGAFNELNLGNTGVFTSDFEAEDIEEDYGEAW